MTAQETIGTILEEPQQRDAIHFALYAVKSPYPLVAGMWVRFKDDSREVVIACLRDEAIGLIDPFLLDSAPPGKSAWMFLMPNTVTSLRHVWEHPAFGPVTDAEPAKFQPFANVSEAWMLTWAKKHMGHDYYGDEERLSDEQAYANAIAAGRNNHVGPYEDARDHIDETWWKHWEAITGCRGDRESYFSCAC